MTALAFLSAAHGAADIFNNRLYAYLRLLSISASINHMSCKLAWYLCLCDVHCDVHVIKHVLRDLKTLI